MKRNDRMRKKSMEENHFIADTRIPSYILKQLMERSDNVLIGYSVVKEYGEERLLMVMKEQGFGVRLTVLRDREDRFKDERYPRDATYILEKI